MLPNPNGSLVAYDMPEATDLAVGIMALVAQQQCDAISRRTKEALAAAKARGVKLGNPNGAAALRRAGKGGTALQETVRQNADEHAAALAPVLEALKAEGHATLRAMADALNARGMMTRRGGRWHVSTVKGLVERIDGLRSSRQSSSADASLVIRADRRPFRVFSEC
jgi:hypothetical protein